MSPPRRLSATGRRRQILSVARELLDTRLLDDITVEEAAEQAGVSPGLLFHYFGSQRNFRREVAEAAARELLAQIEPDPALSPHAQLHAALDAFTAYVARRPGLYIATTRLSAGNQDLSDLHAGIRGTLAAWLLAGLLAAGVPDTPAIRATVAGWLAYTEEILLGWLTEPGMAREEVVALCESACYHLVQAALADLAMWREIDAAIRREPCREDNRAGSAANDPAAILHG
jgi:AcrR family transcriptional regulator